MFTLEKRVKNSNEGFHWLKRCFHSDWLWEEFSKALGSILAHHKWVRRICCCHSYQRKPWAIATLLTSSNKSDWSTLNEMDFYLLHETCINNLYCVGQPWGLTWITKRSMLYTHACMTEHRWVTACACFELPSQIPQAWVWHTIIITLRLLLGPPLLLDTEFNLPWYKTLSCQSNPLTLSVPQSVPPALPLLPCVPSSRAPYMRVLVVQCGMQWGGGRQARQPKKGGAQLFPHTSSTPHWSVAHLTIWGRQSKGCREMELETLSRHTAIETMQQSQHTKQVEEGKFHNATCWKGGLHKH